MGADLSAAASALERVQESPGRGKTYPIRLNSGEALLLDYTRNATMPAMHASLQTLSEMQTGNNGRRIAVLGDLTELDDNPTPFHIDIARVIENHGIDLVFAIGDQMKHMYEALPPDYRGGYAKTAKALAPLIRDVLQDGDVVMAQGWRLLRLNRIVRELVGRDIYEPW